MTSAALPDADAVAGLVQRLVRAIAGSDATAAAVAAAAGGEISDDGPPLAVHARGDVAGVERVTVTRRWDSEVPNAAEIKLAAGLPLTDLELRLGPASDELPSEGPGDHSVVLEGEDDSATTMASLDADGAVRSLTVRRDT